MCCRYIDPPPPSLTASTFPYRYIDPLLNDSAQASPVTDGYAVGVTLLQALTGRPVANLKVVCRKLLRLPDQPAEWEEPGVADRRAGAWPVPLQGAVARVVSGLVFAPVHPPQ